MKKIFPIVICLFTLAFASCSNEEDNGPKVTLDKEALEQDYLSNVDLSTIIADVDVESLDNKKMAVGRTLFYDDGLSLNSRISCATCHKQSMAFADNLSFSKGFDGRLTKRNSPTILNMGASATFFWDMSVNSLPDQVVMPITDHIEMGIPNHEVLIERIKEKPYYEELFSQAYGSEAITIDKVSDALAQFVVSINSFSSKFDDPIDFTELELLGRSVFIESRCNNCHTAMTVAAGNVVVEGGNPYTGGSVPAARSAANIGLDFVPRDPGAGNGAFKIPTLRNLSYTAPYMHDGRFTTLDEVIDHYDSGIKDTEHLDSRLINNGRPMRLGLTQLEKEALKAFLLTFNDHEIVQNPMYSDPFKRD